VSVGRCTGDVANTTAKKTENSGKKGANHFATHDTTLPQAAWPEDVEAGTPQRAASPSPSNAEHVSSHSVLSTSTSGVVIWGCRSTNTVWGREAADPPCLLWEGEPAA